MGLQFDYLLIFHMAVLQHKYKLKYLWGMYFFLSELAASNVVHAIQTIQKSF